MKYLVIISGIIGAALLYLLSSASANTDLFSHNYYVLLAMTGFLALGLAGLVGSGRTETLRAIFGADKKHGGEVFVGDMTKAVSITEPAVAYSSTVRFSVNDLRTGGRSELADAICEPGSRRFPGAVRPPGSWIRPGR